MKYGDKMINELFSVFSTFNFLEHMETSQPGEVPQTTTCEVSGAGLRETVVPKSVMFFFGGKNLAGL